MRPTILILLTCYLPGTKSGGPVRSIANMVDRLSDQFEFKILTSDRDISDEQPYEGIETDTWTRVGKCDVCYLRPEQQSLGELAKRIAATGHDILYINSAFALKFAILPLLAHRLGRIPRKPTVLAPRGEFSPGALSLKASKKRLFLAVGKMLSLYRNVIWHASTEHEATDIRRIIGAAEIKIAIDLPSPPQAADQPPKVKRADELDIVFLSRISPMKNLNYALKTLADVRAKITFDIVGPLEDRAYWKKCQALIETLPSNVVARYLGPVEADEVAAMFGRYDLFFFPTRGENYGHVIAEALGAGTPVLIADTTPWTGLGTHGVGFDLPLSDGAKFTRKIEQYAATPPAEYADMRGRVSAYANTGAVEDDVKANRELFEAALGGKG